ncbi:DHHC palmitoyltransferase-domain-containing protein, partial [Gorgonomyces haynaldii]
LRWCKKCEIMKPDRAHHCSICGICVLKMDHHCPWINNCVWFGNYRFFVQFLFYGFMYSLLMCIWSFQILFQTLDFHLLFVATLGLVFALALLSFLGLHLYYISTNQTTIESLEKRVLCLDECIYVTRRNIYNLGFIRNWQQVVGNAVVFYLLPVGTAMGNGLEFPINQQEIE